MGGLCSRGSTIDSSLDRNRMGGLYSRGSNMDSSPDSNTSDMVMDAHIILSELAGKSPGLPSKLPSISTSSPFNVEIMEEEL